MVYLIFPLFLIIVAVSIIASTLYVVRQQTVVIVERFGKYQATVSSGIHVRMPFGIDKIAARIQLRLLQSELIVETKTNDNV
ncbi:UNVERIFIED_CONTAM: SPFH domain-containing protein, partial [Bacteroidetes bacterium 56_B9]